MKFKDQFFGAFQNIAYTKSTLSSSNMILQISFCIADNKNLYSLSKQALHSKPNQYLQGDTNNQSYQKKYLR